MSSVSGTAVTPAVTTIPANVAGSRLWQDRLLPALLACVLGAALIYAAGFASKVELHNAAHDGRHSAGFPCH